MLARRARCATPVAELMYDFGFDALKLLSFRVTRGAFQARGFCQNEKMKIVQSFKIYLHANKRKSVQ